MSSSMDSVKNRWRRRKYFPCLTTLASYEDDAPCSGSDSASDAGFGRRRKTPHPTFYGSLKALLFRTSLVKKLRSKRSRRTASSKCGEDLITNPSKKEPPARKRLEEILQDDSDGYSLFSSTSASCASSVSSDSRCGSRRMKESSASVGPSKQRGTNIVNRQSVFSSSGCGLYTAMWVVLVCLLTLIFGGRAFATVTCTGTWLFFAMGHCRSSHGG